VRSSGAGDDNRRFLADLRALRDAAALEWDELAARTHYPSDVLKEAGNGPSLPGLPVLAAYVRACDGDVLEWEERWRRLGFDARADPSLPVRSAGASPAAVAGARAAVSVAPPDAYDPERIRAALRGSHDRSNRGGRGRARRDARAPAPDPVVPESPASWSGGTSWDAQPGPEPSWDAVAAPGPEPSWDAVAAPGPEPSWDVFQPDSGAHWNDAAADLGGTLANGNHHASQPGEGPADAAVIETPDQAQAEAIRRDPFSADWLQDSELISAPGLEPEPEWTQAAETGAADSWFTPRETVEHEPTRPTADTEPSPAAPDAWFTPRDRAESEATAAQGDPVPASQDPGSSDPELVTGFWTPSASASASAAAPAPAPAAAPAPAEEHAIGRASWSAPAEAPASDAPGPADRTTPILAQAAAAAAVASPAIAESAVPPGPVVPPSRSRPDRLYPVRLLIVIVVAALIGSILVLLLR
jgi:hypothetical protein